MAHITKQAYQKLASAVASDLCERDIPLNDSILKLARSMDMSQEQIHRLCESANNEAFNSMLKSDKVASDSLEFPVADANVILRNLPVLSEKTASFDADFYEMRPLEYAAWRQPACPDTEGTLEKTAAEALNYEHPVSNQKLHDTRTLEKVHETLRFRKIAADADYEDSLHTLQGDFRKLYHDISFESFERGAIAKYGNYAAPVLNRLRGALHKPLVDYDVAVLQKTAGTVNDTSTSFTKLGQVLSIVTQREKLAKAIAKMESVL